MTTLYEITAQYRGLMLIADELPEDALADTLESITDDMDTKTRHIIHVIKNFDTTAIDVEVKRLQAMKKAITNRKQSLKDYLINNMLACDITKIDWSTGSVAIRKPLDIVSVPDVSLLPESYQKVSVTADKVAIKADLKRGTAVAGAKLEKGVYGLVIK